MAHVPISSYDSDSSGSSVEFITVTPPDTTSDASTKSATVPAKQAFVEDVPSDSENMTPSKNKLPAAKASIRPTDTAMPKSVKDLQLQKLEEIYLNLGKADFNLAGDEKEKAVQATSSDVHSSSSQRFHQTPPESKKSSVAASLISSNTTKNLNQATDRHKQGEITSVGDDDDFEIPDISACVIRALLKVKLRNLAVAIELQNATSAAINFDQQVSQMIYALDSTALKQRLKSEAEDVTHEAKSKEDGKHCDHEPGAWRWGKNTSPLPWALVVLLCLVMFLLIRGALQMIEAQEETIQSLRRAYFYCGQ